MDTRVTCDVYIFPCGCDVEAIQAVSFSFMTANALSLQINYQHELHAQGAYRHD